ncbi:protein kinase domain-containing protein [Rhodococcus wratislaviensis]|uniref:protein kinase domain-containing protein n=1 Tax=Rhodococcus wratislaviensis TaxID=44752 RepID=UPI00365AA7EC
MIDGDPFKTQRDVNVSIVAELDAAGFEDALEIGRGGFGVVYRCAQPSLDRTVAVKVLTEDFDEENRVRFLREQRAMGRLTGHPNIVNVLHVGTTGSQRPYIVMQYHPHGSLETRIRGEGPLRLEEALRLGVKVAGALETAHRLGILHRDVKPGNILLTEYSEPALTDFGIAHIAGGFETAAGTVTGSPAFTAPEVLSGESPSPASDIYGLGATMFCAVTGHAAFERRSGEQVIAQFLRIATQPLPDLREQGIPVGVSSAVERAMATDPRSRPVSAAEFGDELRQIQLELGFPVDEMALLAEPGATRPDQNPSEVHDDSWQRRRRPSPPPDVRSSAGNLPFELTSFVGRRREVTETKGKLSVSRLVTLTGIGGVGKTRLAQRVATDLRRAFRDGVWLVELGELRDGSLLAEVVAAALGVRDRSPRPLEEVVVGFLAPRHLLLVLDNCEQLVDAVAWLVETLLRTCPDLRILATSREPLGIGGEAVLRVPPLTVPGPDRDPSLRGLPQFDAVTLFAERAAAAVPGFVLTDDNRVAVTRICRQLDGLPLAIELAAARLRTMSVEQILDRLADRYKLLTLGGRGAPTRQQTLQLCIDWSYELCTPPEQQLWARLSVFAGSVELDAVETICSGGLAPEDLLDGVAALVDKSILIREDAGVVVRFRMLETLRDYGREKSEYVGEHQVLRRRHCDWYLSLAVEAEAEWVSPRQLEWIARIEREQPNLREAMEFSLSHVDDADTEAGLRIAAALFPFWLARGLLSQGRYWLDRALARSPGQMTVERVEALYADSALAELQGDFTAGTALVEEGRVLVEQMGDATAHARIIQAEGLLAVFRGDLHRASRLLEEARDLSAVQGDVTRQVEILYELGLAYELRGETAKAITCHEQVLAITESRGESMYRSYSLWSMGVAVWRQGDSDRAARLVEQSVRLGRVLDDPLIVAVCLESLAWLCDERSAERAGVLMGAAEELGRALGSSTVLFPHLFVYHQECESRTRRTLGARGFQAALRNGRALGFRAAVAYALGEQPDGATPSVGAVTALTTRERQVADLIAQGMTNKAIAAQLVMSHRTAQGHVEHILAKLGFTSRAQIAAWVVEQGRDALG